jgi:hypothetical protein
LTVIYLFIGYSVIGVPRTFFDRPREQRHKDRDAASQTENFELERDKMRTRYAMPPASAKRDASSICKLESRESS